jgi:hypothetical protein
MHSAAPDPDLAFLERILRFQEGSLTASEMPAFEHEIRTEPTSDTSSSRRRNVPSRFENSF